MPGAHEESNKQSLTDYPLVGLKIVIWESVRLHVAKTMYLE